MIGYLFVDASFCQVSKKSGLGIILRDSKVSKSRNKPGKIILKQNIIISVGSSEKAEFIALVSGLKLAKSLGYTEIYIYSDYRSLIKALNKKSPKQKSCGRYAIIEQYKDSFKKIRFLYKNRKNNKAAHHQARLALSTL